MQSVPDAFPFQIDHVHQLDAVLNDGMVVVVGKEAFHPVGIFKTAGMIKVQGERAVPGSHIEGLQIRIMVKKIFNQAAAVSLSLEQGGGRYIFKLLCARTFVCHHTFCPDRTV